jgi:hypothetical protein
MKIKIIAILIISAVMVSFASSRAAKKKTTEKSAHTVVAKPGKFAGFVSEEI